MATSPQLKFVFTADISNAEKAMNKTIGHLKRMSKEALSTAANMTFVTDAFKRIGKIALEGSRQSQEAFKKIRAGTGATGEALNGLLADFKKVNAQTSQSTEQIAAALADLHTRLGISGDALQSMTLAAAEASRMTGQELSGLANEAAKAMNAMSLSGEQGAAMIDKLFIASQSTNVGMAELASETAKYSGVLQAAGLSLDQSIAMLSSFSNAGLNSKKVMSGVTSALSKFAKAGVSDMGAELNKAINAIRSAATESKAAQIAVDVFGASGTAMAQAIRSGRFEVGELTEKLRNSQGAVQAAAKDSGTFADSWARTQKSLVMALEPLGTALLSLGEKYVIPAVQWLGSFTAAGNEAVAMFGVLAVASGPIIGNLSALSMALMTGFKGFHKIYSASMTFYKGSILLGGVLARHPELIKETAEATAKATNAFLTNASASTKLNAALSGLSLQCSKLITWLSGPAGLLFALGAAAAFLVGDYIMSSRRAQQETAAFRAEIEKLAQSLAGLSDRELSVKIAGSQEQVRQLTARYQERKRQIDAEIDQEREMNAAVYMTRVSGYRPEESKELETLKKQISQEQTRLMTALGEQGLRDAQTYISEIRGRFDDQLKGAKTAEAARALAVGFVEQLGAKAKEFTADSKAGQAFAAAQKQINDAARTYRPAVNTGSYQLPAAKTPKVPKVAASKDDLLERLRWQNSAGFLSDADYQAALAAQFQKLTGGKGYETWSKDARSAYDELERLKKSQASKAAETLKWQNSAGFVKNASYADILKERLTGLTGGGADYSSWTEEARGVFDEMRAAAVAAMDSLNEQLEKGKITTSDYTTQAEALKAKFAEFEPISEELKEKMQQNKGFYQTFITGMQDAAKESVAAFEKLSVTIGTNLADSFARAVAYGEDLGESLQKLGQDIVYTVTKMLMMQAITGLFGGKVPSPFSSANGNAFGPAGLIPFANGGIVGRPTLFKFAGGTGLMGEAGPEAIMPLERDSHGRLGVHASGSAGGVYAPQFNVTVNNNGGGDMSDEQAESMSRALCDAIDARVAEDLYNYRRMGYYGGAFA